MPASQEQISARDALAAVIDGYRVDLANAIAAQNAVAEENARRASCAASCADCLQSNLTLQSAIKAQIARLESDMNDACSRENLLRQDQVNADQACRNGESDTARAAEEVGRRQAAIDQSEPQLAALNAEIDAANAEE